MKTNSTLGIKTLLLSLLLAGTAMMASDGSELYKKCVACHGAHAEKMALGKSKVIRELSKEELLTALKGYQDGSYGSSMKVLMKAQVSNLNDEEIRSLATYITTMK